MQSILAAIHNLSGFQGLLEDLKGSRSIPSLGLGRAARLPMLAALHQATRRPILLLTQRTDRALTLLDELGLWLPESATLYFPEPTSLFYENAPWGENTRRERLLALTTLASGAIPGAPKPGQPPILVAPARAVMARALPRRDFLKATRSLRPGDSAKPNELAQTWLANGYESTNTVVTTGQFARRGGILDIWPPADSSPTRLEFFGDEIESLRHFDPASQRTTQAHERLFIPPAREFVVADEAEASAEPYSEFHIPRLHPTRASLFDYLPDDALVLVDDMEAFRDTVNELEEQAVGLRADYEADGTLPADYPIPYLTLAEIEDSLDELRTVELGPAGAAESSPLAQAFSTNPRFGGRLKPLTEHLQAAQARGDDIFLVSRQAARLQEVWQENQRDIDEEPPRFMEGSLEEGWLLTPEEGAHIHLLTDGEIFGWARPQPRPRARVAVDAPESNYVEFQPDDLVVHVDYGIGRFRGLVRREIEQTEQEYLAIEYAEGDQLYVPVHQADRLSRYIGARGHRPAISRLSSVEWKHIKERVQKAVEKVAEDLLELYAKRQVVQGHAFGPDHVWQRELEASFPYVETEDQLRVIAEVKHDMENQRPMDRLVCGDVGYGKTEVALRAAFKAVMNGKQVALLVPTTILAQQHYETFRQRLAAFPVVVEMLSRFRTPAEQREVLFRLSQGVADIVIGTHRLVQPDVQFKDLGLVIIDEEQRFGVTHKEHLKKLRTEVDVLTMTATPIPRTLYMALAGVRDISTINTPPEERLPIITHVGPYSAKLLRQAILRELERGGQVFLVHNRVQTIDGMRVQVERLVPEARTAIAHGQMAERELAERMSEFTNGEIDVLVTTSIIESGLDIPNANTLIVDRADTFGLAQLYQLRGRVGRGAQRAYAYFFRHRTRTSTDTGRMRLDTIAENTQLGAGFSIAMRDLEIRGSGDFLGTRQHGHIAAVGLNLYTRLLSQAVKEIRSSGGFAPDSVVSTAATFHPLINVDLPLPISIPAEYVPDQEMRLRLYRRLADIHALDQIQPLADEFADRFGPLPETVQNMLYHLRVKLLAEQAGLASVTTEGEQIVLRFPAPADDAAPRRYPDLGDDVRASKNTVRMLNAEGEGWQERLLEILDTLVANKETIRDMRLETA